jgi:hypothetical protein
MRTTITIDDRLLSEIKHRASETGSTVSRLIGDSLRLALDSPPSGLENRQAFGLVTYGRGGQFSKFDLDKTSALLEAEDLERFRRGEP